MARHRAAGSRNRARAADAAPFERRSVRSGLDAIPLWTGLLLTAADAVNRSWFTAFAWLAVATRAVKAVLDDRRTNPDTERRLLRVRRLRLVRLFRLQERRYRDHEKRSSDRIPRGHGRGGERDAGSATGS